jgi:hypothetical protein
MITQAQLKEAKKAAKREFQKIDGVEALGLGEACLNILHSKSGSKRQAAERVPWCASELHHHRRHPGF